MTKTAIVIRHVLSEDLGVLDRQLRGRGYDIQYRDAGVNTVSTEEAVGADLLVALGGPIGVNDRQLYPYLTEELQAISARLSLGTPTLGICLGAQLIAAALGADVDSTGRVEIGYAPLTLTSAGSDSPLTELGDIPVLHWHGDEFGIPQDTERLAETPGFPNQAFRRGQHVLGLQFHLEADYRTIERWLILNAMEISSSGIDIDAIRRDALQYGPELQRRAEAVINRWLDETEVEAR